MLSITKNTKTKFYESFGRTEKSVEEDVEIIKNWMKTQPHLPEIMDAAKIKNFLNMNKFSIEKTKQKIDMYYTLRTIMPQMFLNPKLPSMQRAFDQVSIFYQSKLLDDLHRVLYWCPKTAELDCPEEVVNMFFSMFEIRLLQDFMMDDILICNWSNISLKGLMKYPPSTVQKFFSIYQKIYSLRIYKIYYINSPPFITHLLTIIKSILKQKIFDRIEVHTNADVLKQIFPADDIPKDFGGNGPSLDSQTNLMRETLEKNQHIFDQLDTLKVNEDLRPEKLDNDELLGYYGNFKKIEID